VRHCRCFAVCTSSKQSIGACYELVKVEFLTSCNATETCDMARLHSRLYLTHTHGSDTRTVNVAPGRVNLTIMDVDGFRDRLIRDAFATQFVLQPITSNDRLTLLPCQPVIYLLQPVTRSASLIRAFRILSRQKFQIQKLKKHAVSQIS